MAGQGRLAIVKLRLSTTKVSRNWEVVSYPSLVMGSTFCMGYFIHLDFQQKSNGIYWQTLSTSILRQVSYGIDDTSVPVKGYSSMSRAEMG